jgi:hypothetical protein
MHRVSLDSFTGCKYASSLSILSAPCDQPVTIKGYTRQGITISIGAKVVHEIDLGGAE